MPDDDVPGHRALLPCHFKRHALTLNCVRMCRAVSMFPASTAALLSAAADASSTECVSAAQVSQLAAMSAALTVQKAASEKLVEGAERVGLLKGGFVKGQWTKEEDELVCKYVELYGTKQWARIALVLPGRKGKQCRERWHNHLNPDINKDAWTNDEDLKLVAAHLVSPLTTHPHLARLLFLALVLPTDNHAACIFSCLPMEMCICSKRETDGQKLPRRSRGERIMPSRIAGTRRSRGNSLRER